MDIYSLPFCFVQIPFPNNCNRYLVYTIPCSAHDFGTYVGLTGELFTNTPTPVLLVKIFKNLKLKKSRQPPTDGKLARYSVDK